MRHFFCKIIQLKNKCCCFQKKIVQLLMYFFFLKQVENRGQKIGGSLMR